MKGFGHPVQKSVFECLLGEGHIARMEEMLREESDRTDLIRVYRLCESCRHKATVIGEGTVAEDEAGFVE